MELRQLQYFVAVAEELHFGRAAERLHMAQSPLSRHIRTLERELRAPLLRRTTRRVELTSAGEALLVRARDILREVDATTRLVGRLAGGAAHPVRMAFTGCTLHDLAGVVLGLVREIAVQAQIDLRTDLLTRAQAEAIAAGVIDLGFTARPDGPIPEGLAMHTVRTQPLAAVLPLEHRLARQPVVELRDLAEDLFVAFPGAAGGSVVRCLAERACAEAGFRPRVVGEAHQTNAVFGLVGAGLGVALLPLEASVSPAMGVVARPLTTEHPVETAMVWRKDEERPLVRRLVAALCREHGCVIDPRCCGARPCQPEFTREAAARFPAREPYVTGMRAS